MCDADDDLKREFSTPDVEPSPGWTRREFVMSALASATGLALAATSAWAQMITTGTQGLTAGDVKIPTRDMQVPAYRAMPATGNNFPVVLVVADIYRRRANRQRSSFIPTRRTHSTPTTGLAIARKRHRTAGSGCWSGSGNTALPRKPLPL